MVYVLSFWLSMLDNKNLLVTFLCQHQYETLSPHMNDDWWDDMHSIISFNDHFKMMLIRLPHLFFSVFPSRTNCVETVPSTLNLTHDWYFIFPSFVLFDTTMKHQKTYTWWWKLNQEVESPKRKARRSAQLRYVEERTNENGAIVSILLRAIRRQNSRKRIDFFNFPFKQHASSSLIMFDVYCFLQQLHHQPYCTTEKA